MIKRVLATAAVAAGLAAALAAPASAAEVCYDLHVNLNGTVVAQAECVPVG